MAGATEAAGWRLGQTTENTLERNDLNVVTESSARTDRELPVVAVVGGVGSGKSSLARFVAQRFPAEIIDADLLGHQVLQREDVKRQIRERFDSEIFDAAGEIQRSALARTVFGEESRPLQDLEAIVHPRIREAIRQRIEAAGKESNARAILLDAAVLLESGWTDICDKIVFVDCAIDVRRQRVLARGWDAEQLHQREAKQLPVDEKRRRANFVINNDSDLQSAGNRLLQIVGEIADQFAKAGSTGSASVDHLPSDTSESVAFHD